MNFFHGVRVMCLLLTATCLAAGAQGSYANTPSEESQERPPAVDDVVFDLPDLVATLDTPHGDQYRLEAFQIASNQHVVSSANNGSVKGRTGRLRWVSFGMPMLIKTPSPHGTRNASVRRLFHNTRYGFYVKLQMLTDEQRQLLAASANAKYGDTSVTKEDIIFMALSKFRCTSTFFDADTNKTFSLRGEVGDFHTYPLIMDFKMAPFSDEKKAFMRRLSQYPQDDQMVDLLFSCEMSKGGKKRYVNRLTISQNQMVEVGLKDALFGRADGGVSRVNTYVTRSQMTLLSKEMYTQLNIVEDYQIPDSEFSEAFITALVADAMTDAFGHVPFDAALRDLSSYGLKFDADLQADRITNELSSIMSVEQKGDKSRIMLANDKAVAFQSSRSGNSWNSQSNQGSGSAFWGLVGGSGGSSTASGSGWSLAYVLEGSTKTLDEQLKEINSMKHSDITFKVEGTRIVPKSLFVARVQQSSVSRALTLNRVRIQTSDVLFQRSLSLYTTRAFPGPSQLRTCQELSASLFDLKNVIAGLNNKTSQSVAFLTNAVWKEFRIDLSNRESLATFICRLEDVHSFEDLNRVFELSSVTSRFLHESEYRGIQSDWQLLGKAQGIRWMSEPLLRAAVGLEAMGLLDFKV